MGSSPRHTSHLQLYINQLSFPRDQGSYALFPLPGLYPDPVGLYWELSCPVMAKNTNMRWRLPLICLLWEVAMIILFGVFVRFTPEASARWEEEEKKQNNITSDIENDFYYRYPCEYLARKCYPHVQAIGRDQRD